jgi:Tfp pilus assembly protein PilE
MSKPDDIKGRGLSGLMSVVVVVLILVVMAFAAYTVLLAAS